MTLIFLVSIIATAIISLLVTPATIALFRHFNWVEDPKTKNKKTHNATALSSIPRGGGIPIFVSTSIILLVLLPLDKRLIGILLASLLTVVIGVWDDLKDISPKLRLATNLMAALLVVASGIGIAYISNPFGGIIDLSVIRFTIDFLGPHTIWVISDLLAIFWIVWCMNSIGWATGVDGQLPGFAAISAFFIGLLAMRFGDASQLSVIVICGAVAGAFLGYLPFNIFPQKAMPGYSGKSLAGFFLALVAILSGAKLATVIFVLGVPMLDGFFTLVRRFLHHRPLLQADGQHLHHRLLALGWSRSQIAIAYWCFSLILGIVALTLNSQQKFYAFIGIFLVFAGIIIRLSKRT